MKQISELSGILGKYLGWHKSRRDCFAGLLFALFSVRTINLRELAIAFLSKAEVDSRYKRLKRFFAGFEMDISKLSLWIYRLYFSSNEPVYLTIDRTNWYFGKSKINILLVGIAYEGLSIPLCWKLLNKAGNATAQEHIDIITRFVHQLGKQQLIGVLGDREFASGRLFQWCNEEKIPFYIRIKEGSVVYVRGKRYKTTERVFRHLNPKEQYFLPMDVEMFGQSLYLAGSRSETGELMIVATNQPNKEAIAVYLRRWEIECLFQALKGRGFRFEDTHVTHLERINRLVALLAVAFAWAHKVGEWRATQKPIPQNKHRDSTRPQYSFFRYGLDWIRDCIFQTQNRTKRLRSCVKLIKIDCLQPELGGIS